MKTCRFSNLTQSRTLDDSIGAGETITFDLCKAHRARAVMNMYPEIEPIGSLEASAKTSESIEYKL